MNPLIAEITSQTGLPLWLILVVVAWTLVWKALALWTSARRNHPIWFILFLLIQTLGILEILYIFLFSKIELPHLDKKDKKMNFVKKKKRK